MSLDLKFEIYPKEDGTQFTCDMLFQRFAEKLENWEFFNSTWYKYSVRTNLASDEPEFGKFAPTTSNAISQAFNESDIKNKRYFTAGMSLPCWLYNRDSLKMEYDSVGLFLSIWDPDYGSGRELYWRSCANIIINPVKSFFTKIVEETGDLDEKHREYNEGVLKNLEIIRQLFRLIIESFDPLSVKTFMCNGWEVPFNSHATYFANPEVLIKDLHMIKDLWSGDYEIEEGVPPLKDYHPKKHAWFYSSMRPEEQRKELWEEYSTLLLMLDYVTPEIVEQAWNVEQSVDEGWLDIQRTNNGGALIYGSKDFFNSFVSRVYLDALEIAYHLKKEEGFFDSL